MLSSENQEPSIYLKSLKRILPPGTETDKGDCIFGYPRFIIPPHAGGQEGVSVSVLHLIRILIVFKVPSNRKVLRQIYLAKVL